MMASNPEQKEGAEARGNLEEMDTRKRIVKKRGGELRGWRRTCRETQKARQKAKNKARGYRDGERQTERRWREVERKIRRRHDKVE